MPNNTEITSAKRLWGIICRFFVPKYNEIAIFLMAIAFVLLVLFDLDLKTSIKSVIHKAFVSHAYGRETVWAFMVAVLFISGFILSIYHVFSSKRKSETEKTLMLVFALGISGFAGIIAGLQVINDYHGLLIVFPVLNILSSVVLLYLIGFAEHSIISDEDALLQELLFGSVITGIVFYFCQFRFNFHWSITFSICVTYVMIFNNILGGFLTRKRA